MVTTNPFDFNPDHLQSLARTLERLPLNSATFSMSDFYSAFEPKARARLRADLFMRSKRAPVPPAFANPVGWGAYAGVQPLPEHYVFDPETGEHFDWLAYSQHLIGGANWGRNFNWLFGQAWAKIDNTPRGAALRIRDLLKHGRPPARFNDPADARRPILYVVP